MAPRPPRSPLFPYTTLFRSGPERLQLDRRGAGERLLERGHQSGPLRRRPAGDREPEGHPTSLEERQRRLERAQRAPEDRKSTRLNSSHMSISYAVFCLKKKK